MMLLRTQDGGLTGATSSRILMPNRGERCVYVSFNPSRVGLLGPVRRIKKYDSVSHDRRGNVAAGVRVLEPSAGAAMSRGARAREIAWGAITPACTTPSCGRDLARARHGRLGIVSPRCTAGRASPRSSQAGSWRKVSKSTRSGRQRSRPGCAPNPAWRCRRSCSRRA